eukprot:m.336728 g.336728  ORF g.336728 m.336728 type:complete len:442 (+) comp17942_c0_seq1:56-1381(+)
MADEAMEESGDLKRTAVELQKVEMALEQMQKAARDLVGASQQFASAMDGWAVAEKNPTYRAVILQALAPVFDEYGQAQSEMIQNVKSFSEYELTTIEEGAQNHGEYKKKLDKAQRELEKKSMARIAAATKGDAKAAKAIAMEDNAKLQLAEAQKEEQEALKDFERLKHSAFRSGITNIARGFQRMSAVGSVCFKALESSMQSMPEHIPIASQSGALDTQVSSYSSKIPLEKAKVLSGLPMFYKPGSFLKKKPEKRGSTTTRFFQLEKIEDEGLMTWALVYYKGVPTHYQDGDKKGHIVINRTSQITDSGKELMIVNQRKWVLIADTPAEAKWWRDFLELHAKSLDATPLPPTFAIIHPEDTPEPPTDARATSPATSDPFAAERAMESQVASSIAGVDDPFGLEKKEETASQLPTKDDPFGLGSNPQPTDDGGDTGDSTDSD